MVSVIIPCYNQGAYLQEAIDSVKAQTYTRWEIIIVNDGSDDELSRSVLSALHGQGYHIINIKNSGVSVARNTGIEAANGEYILPLDADDKIGPDYLEEAVKVLENDPGIKLVYADCAYFGSVTGPLTLPAFSIKGMLSQNLVYNAAIIRKADFLKTGGYDPAFLVGWEDWEFWLRFIKDEKEVFKLPGTHFYYRRKAQSRNESLINDKRATCEQQLFKKHINLFLTHYSNPISLISEQEAIKAEFIKLDHYKKQINESFSYRLGNMLLFPFKKIRSMIKV